MRTRTAVVLVLVLLALGGVAGYGFVNQSAGTLSVEWVSETPRPNQVNHHPATAAVSDGRIDIVAPVSAVAGENARCRVTMLDANGSIRWQRAIDPDRCAIHGIGDGVIADATGDGNADVLVPTTENRLYVYNATDGSTEWTQNLTSFGYAGPVVLGSPQPLVVQPDFRGMVFALTANGSVAWRHDINETVLANPQRIDVPGTSEPTVAIGSTSNVTVFSANGTVVWQRAARATWLAAGRHDGRDIVIASGGSTVTAFTANGTQLWQREDRTRPSLGHVSGGDNGDTPKVYVGSGGDAIAALNVATGATEWRTELGIDANMLPPPAIGDVDGDGSSEVVAVTNGGTVHVMNPTTGEVRASYRRDVAVWAEPTLFDIDNDGAEEIVIMYGDGRVVALSYHAA
ncbi:PQQ-binding-like beta-propeller repeat protein (plasmid) [Halarchaeum sp. CBA1220]|uniref:outer membrane protein assembly factor BamB family protein n=1 Tax=Halarchaeum sp. CBA1220 TaxID=1853682 RepID=UPI000F3A886C|nr:PQQ-binding-like beta-propeller repeat protein [Halarchaeum sp. CBA1220]QLC35393.1 PQQ-binding-like beta-propeller repeat protein [Halarchaeum sp. CBA1220]